MSGQVTVTRHHVDSFNGTESGRQNKQSTGDNELPAKRRHDKHVSLRGPRLVLWLRLWAPTAGGAQAPSLVREVGSHML